MTSDRERRERAIGRDAADWYVELDANPHDHDREARLRDWLERSPDHEAAFERCEAAVMLARELAARGELDSEGIARGELGRDAAARAELGGGAEARAELGVGARARAELGVGAGARKRGELAGSRGASHGARALVDLGQRLLGWLGRPSVAWSVAATAVVWAVAATVERGAPAGAGVDRPAVTADAAGAGSESAVAASDGATLAGAGNERGAAASGGMRLAEVGNERAAGTSDDARLAAVDDGLPENVFRSAEGAPPTDPAALLGDVSAANAFVNPVAVLPGEIVVNVHSVAVLPFDVPETEQGAALGSEATSAGAVPDSERTTNAQRIAMQLYDEVLRQLARIPGVYVRDRSSAAAYSETGLAPDQIAAFLGVRGVVAAEVELDGQIIRVSLRMTDAANSGRRTEATFERPLDDFPAVGTAIVSNIADVLASAAF